MGARSAPSRVGAKNAFMISRINARRPPRIAPHAVESLAIQRAAIRRGEQQLARDRLAVWRAPRERDRNRRVLAHMLGQDGDNPVCQWSPGSSKWIW